MTDITPETSGVVFALKSLTIPDETTQEQWAEIHRSIIVAQGSASKWLRQSRQWGETKFGAEYVGETEAQIELALGLAQQTKPRIELNPEDKAKAIVTIEGLSTSFGMWYRKMQPSIEQWEADKLYKALELIEPMEAAAKKIRERITHLNGY
jgi:hypothetical protein